MGQAAAMDWTHFPQQTKTGVAKSPMSNGDDGPRGGSVRYDAVQGTWVRVEPESASQPNQEVLPGSDPAPPFVANADDEPQEKGGRESGSVFKWSSWFRSEPEKRQISVTTPPEEMPELEMKPAAMREDAVIEPFMTIAQDLARPEPPVLTIDNDTPAPAPLSTPNWSQGETMWQSETNVDESGAQTALIDGMASQAVPEQDTSRWSLLKCVLGDKRIPLETPDAPTAAAPVLEVFSLAGGVGKTSLVASLGRALAARGEYVLLVDATPLGSLPYFFGSCECRPGVVRTFRPPAASSDAPIRLATIDSDGQAAENGVQSSLANEIGEWARGMSRVIVDVATRSTATVRALARMSPTVLVPLIPDLNSILTAKSIDSFFQNQAGAQGTSSEVYFVLNEFDSSLPLHLDVRNMLREKWGERLLPFELQRAAAVSDALAEGMTIMDYAPDSRIAGDFANLAKWLQNVAAPADMRARSKRWSER